MKLYSFHRDTKCPGCNWDVEVLYILAESKDVAKELVDDIGLCGNCIADLLVDTGYEINTNTGEEDNNDGE